MAYLLQCLRAVRSRPAIWTYSHPTNGVSRVTKARVAPSTTRGTERRFATILFEECR